MLKVAGFDLDDTLYRHWDFERVLFKEIAEKLASRFGVSSASLFREMKRLFEEKCRDGLFDKAFLNAGYTLPVDWSSCMQTQIVPFYRTHRPRIRLKTFGWVRPLIRELKNHHQVRTVLITNGGVSIQNTKIDLLHIRDLFDRIYISDQFCPPERKPDTKIFMRVLSDLHVHPRSMAYVGDSEAIDGSCAKIGIQYLQPHEAGALCSTIGANTCSERL